MGARNINYPDDFSYSHDWFRCQVQPFNAKGCADNT